jgi:hypothetical protein
MRAVARPAHFAALAAAIATLASGPGAAAEWQFDPTVEGGVLYNDNYTLARPRDGEIDVQGVYADLDLALRLESPRTTWRVAPRIRARYFPDDSEVDSNDYYLSAGVTNRGQRYELGLAADYYDEDIITAELPGTDFGDVGLGEGGALDGGRIIIVDNRRDLLMVRPYASFDASERLVLSVDASLFDVSFDNQIQRAQEDYQSLGAGAGLAWRFDEKSTLGFRVQYTQVDPADVRGDTDILGGRLQWDYRVAERVRAYARAGVDRSEYSVSVVLPMGVVAQSTLEETTPMYGIGGEWTLQRSQVFLDAQRNIDANSAGAVIVRDEFRLSVRHRFSTQLTGTAAAYFVQDGSVADLTTVSDRDYYAASAGLEWRFQRALTVGGVLDFAKQDFVGDPEDADSFGFRLFLRYQPNRRD